MSHYMQNHIKQTQLYGRLSTRCTSPTLADFETMKKVLMRDLQSRCEKVVELEITLDETRIQQNNLLKATSNKAQQKKMVLLERNLDQLTNVQKQVDKQTYTDV